MNQTAKVWLELPPGLAGVSPEAMLALNDRFRTIADTLNGSVSASGSSSGSGGGRQLILTVPGTLGVRTDAAPRVELSAAAAPVEIRAIVKQPSQGASLVVKVRVANSAYTTITLPALAGELGLVGRLPVIPVNAMITLDVVQVGTTFPGADLSLLLRF